MAQPVPTSAGLDAAGQSKLEQCLRELSDAWSRGQPPDLAALVGRAPADQRQQWLQRLVEQDLACRRGRGAIPTPDEYLSRFPADGELIAAALAGLTLACQPAAAPADATENTNRTETWTPGARAAAAVNATLPQLEGYAVLATLGRGGMGYVLKARHLKLDRLVAIKLPFVERLRDESDLDRFLREARSAGRLRHPNICPIYEIGQAGDRPYIAMGYIEGQSLGECIRAERLSGHRAAQIVATLAEAVAYAHQHGVVHRDIKPANVMIDRESGQPILMDFGLAKELGDEETQLTQTGMILGTPAYMAPEQARGQPDQIGPPADVYALGAVLYALVCGGPPYSGSFADVLRKLQTEPPPPPRRLAPSLHRDLETICLKAMAHEPANRYSSAGELAADLRRFCAGEAIQARPEGLWPRIRRRLKRNPLTTAALAVVLVGLIAAAVMGERARRQHNLTQQIEELTTRIDAVTFQPELLDEMQPVLADLTARDATAAQTVRTRLYQRASQVIRQEIGRAALGPQDLDRIDEHLKLLARYEPDLAAQMQRELALRLRAWVSLFQLSPPFANTTDVFPGKVAAKEGRLTADPAQPADKNTAQPADAIAAQSDFIEMKIASVGSVRLEATFDNATVNSASTVGLALNVAGKDGYHMLLALPAADKIAGQDSTKPEWRPTTLAKARDTNRPVELRLTRNGVTVRRQEARLRGAGVRLLAQRVGGRLTLQVNSEAPLVFDDVFPLLAPGVFGVLLPPGGSLSSMGAWHQLLPPEASPLERGDQFFAAGDFQQALESYRSQEAAATDDVRRESRFKQALCLVQLRQRREAESLLESVASEEAPRWPLVAAAHLWQLRVEDRRFAEAEPLLQRLTAQYRFDELALLLPESTRNGLLGRYHESVRGVSIVNFNAQRLVEMERVRDVERLMTGRLSSRTLNHLVRAYRAVGRDDLALGFAREAMWGPDREPLTVDESIWFVEEYCWMLRRAGKAAEALVFVDGWAIKNGQRVESAYMALLVERARILIALDRWDEAAADLDHLLTHFEPGQMEYRLYSGACLVRGFCHLERGDHEAALASWRAGMYRHWQPSRLAHLPPGTSSGQRPPPTAIPAPTADLFSGLEMVQFVLLASLSQDATDQEISGLFQWLTRVPGDSADLAVVQAAVGVLQNDFAGNLFRGLCNTPRGRQVARSLALRQVDFAETARYPGFLCLYEVARQGAFARELSDEEDQALWKLVEVAFDQHIHGKVSKTQVLAMAFTWKGTTGFLGWDGVAPGLDPQFRGYLAWVMGHRFQRLKRPQDATKFFTTTLTDSPADSPLHALAQAGLNQ